jgi:glycosyltransferase involved in cell wall biosynthesis
VLFIGPLPEPVTGQSLACQVLSDALRESGASVEVLNLTKQELRQGIRSLSRVTQILRLLGEVWRKHRSCDVVYLTVSESVAGNVKDLFIYMICAARLATVVIHLHGGAGMRELLLGEHRILRWLNSLFLRKLGAIIVLGRRHVDIYSQSAGAEQIRIVPNFAHDSLFVDVADIDRKFERTVPLRLLFLSNLLPGNGHRELADAYLSLDVAEKAAVEVDFAGAFESAAQKAEFLQLIGGEPGLRYHGVVHGDDKRRLFKNAHVFCLPTYYPYEGQPISISRHTRPDVPVTTDHKGIFDVFADGVNGAVAKASADLVAAIRRRIRAPIGCGLWR